MELVVRSNGVAEWRDFSFRCALGCNGVTLDKREGDGATPAGVMRLTRVLYRADRIAAPTTRLALSPIAPSDGWCDAPEDPLYNRPVELPYDASAEALWRDDTIYDLIALTDYNDGPVVAGKGSAIFVHVARSDYRATQGCVAFARHDLQRLLAGWRTEDRVRVMAP